MEAVILTKTYQNIPLCESEIFRYCGFFEVTDDAKKLLSECLSKLENRLTYKVCFCELPVKTEGNVCDFSLFCVKSADLAKNMAGCDKAVIFAATVGIEIDRIVSKYSKIAPAKALMFEAIGNERIEALCDKFCSEFELQNITQPRFSPGYGDLPLATQRDFFSLLDCQRKIGLTLNDSLLMSPSKSVTAFLGIKKQ